MQVRVEFAIPLAFSLIICACTTTGSVTTDLPTDVPSHTPNPTSTAGLTPTHTPTSSPTCTPSPTATPFGGSQTTLMGIEICSDQFWKPCRYEGTVRVDFRTGSANLLWDGKFNAEAFSPDGQYLLLSSGTNLYIADSLAQDPIQICSNFAKGPELSALWIRPDLIAFLGTRGSEKYVYTMKPDGTALRAITHWRRIPYQLVPVQNSEGVLWEEAWWEPKGRLTGGYYWTDFETMTTHQISSSFGLVSPSPSGNQIAYQSWSFVQDARGRSHLMSLDLRTMESHDIPLPDLGERSTITNLVWLPDGVHLLVGRKEWCAANATTPCVTQASIFDLDGIKVMELPELFGQNPWNVTPDGRLLYLISIHEDENGWSNVVAFVNLEMLLYRRSRSSQVINFNDAPLSLPVLWSPDRETDNILMPDYSITITPTPQFTSVPSTSSSLNGDATEASYALPQHIDIISAEYSIIQNSLEITIALRDLPEELQINRYGGCEGCWEYLWAVFVDNDNNSSTGGAPGMKVPGWEYALFLSVYYEIDAQPGYKKISDHAFVEMLRPNYSGGWTSSINPSQFNFQIDHVGNTITIFGNLNGINSDAFLVVYAFDDNPTGSFQEDLFVPSINE